MSDIHSAHAKHDLDWRAFCYVAGEMTDAEGEQFERELAEDQQACEAVARAIELTTSLELAIAASVSACVPPTPASSAAAANRRRPLMWLAYGSVACLMLVAACVALQFFVGGRPSGPVAEAPSNVKAAQLAVVWSESRGSILPRDSSLVFAPGWLVESAEPAEPGGLAQEPDGVAGERVDQPTTPVWMLTALAGLMENADAPGELSQ